MDDYPIHSLSHAVHLDERFDSDHPSPVGYAQTAHPGLFFQFASWLAYRISVHGSSFAERFDSVMSDATAFDSSIKVAPLVITLLAWFAVSVALCKQVPLYYALATALVPLSISASPPYVLGYLGNDTFALPLAILLFVLVTKASYKFSAYLWILVGAVAGLTYLNKLNYISWAVGALIGCFLGPVLAKRNNLVQSILGASLLVIGFIIATAVLSLLALGEDGTWEMLRRHRSFAQHDGFYGTGEPNYVDLTLFVNNVSAAFAGYPMFFILVIAALIQSTWVASCRWFRSDDSARKQLLTTLATFYACGFLTLIAAFKHYQPHYLIPVTAILTCIVWWSGANYTKPIQRLFILPFIIFALVESFHKLSLAKQHEQETIKNTKHEVSEIKSLPLEADELILWTYRVNAAEFTKHHMALLTGSAWVDAAIKQKTGRDSHFDITSPHDASALDTTNWRYAVFQNGYFPTDESFPAYFRGRAVLKKRFASLVVLERSSPSADLDKQTTP